MSGALGYGSNLPLLMSVRNVDAITINEGQAIGYSPPATAILLSGDNMVNTSNGKTDDNFASGSQIMEGVRQDNATAADRFLGIAYNEMLPGGDGHVVLWGHCRCEAAAAIVLDDSLVLVAHQVGPGLSAANADMIGVAREAAAAQGDLFYAYVKVTANQLANNGLGGTDA